MQFLATLTLLLTVVSTTLANRADTIKAGLAVVGNHQYDKYHSHKKAATGASMGNMMHHANEMRKAKQTNNRIGGAVSGVKRVTRRSFAVEDDLELIGRDGTHEYFKRALVDDDELYGRDFDLDDLF
ncbi:hypothetical protein BKA70DRAFT_1556451 [Coprinopsis sp. MPI-PUGE-AT-0042]|nr:hypothetical protein BKA70DRAFT_1556451 [Coprinopsis sp. MPI-PUGE-AT-0042]